MIDPTAYFFRRIDEEVPEPQLPAGYGFAHDPGIEATRAIWTEIMHEVFQGDNALQSADFEKLYGTDPTANGVEFAVILAASHPVAIGAIAPHGNRINFSWIAVREPHRGKGLGERLLRRLMNLARADGHRVMYSHPKERRETMIRLLERLGFKRSLNAQLRVALFIKYFDQEFEFDHFLMPSIRSQTRKFDEIWLCVDDSKQHVRSRPGVMIARSDEEFDGKYSPGSACELAMSTSWADIYMETDADCVLSPTFCEDYLKILTGEVKKIPYMCGETEMEAEPHPKGMYCGPRLYVPIAVAKRTADLGELLKHADTHGESGQRGRHDGRAAFHNCNVAYPRECWQAAHYSGEDGKRDDIEFYGRANRRGWRALPGPTTAYVLHVGERDEGGRLKEKWVNCPQWWEWKGGDYLRHNDLRDNPKEFHLIAGLLQKAKIRSVLDVGCAFGKFGEYVPEGVNYTGLDISRKMIWHCGKRYPKREFIVGDVMSSGLFPTRTWEAVVALQLLEHFKEPEFVARRLLDLADRCVVVSVPNENARQDSAHVSEIGRDDLARMFGPYEVLFYQGREDHTLCLVSKETKK